MRLMLVNGRTEQAQVRSVSYIIRIKQSIITPSVVRLFRMQWRSPRGSIICIAKLHATAGLGASTGSVLSKGVPNQAESDQFILGGNL